MAGVNKLTARGAATTKPGQYGDGAGLYLIVSPSGARKWVFRYAIAGKVRMMGLGGANDVSLADARARRDEARRLLASGGDPIDARRVVSEAAPTFGRVADDLLAAKRSSWRSQKHAKQWERSLTVECGPLRDKPVASIDVVAILQVLKPAWASAPVTASRLRQRVEMVLDAAAAAGLRSGDNPARWRGHLEHLLPKPPKLEKAHHPAMDYRGLPGFIEKLRADPSLAARALEFTILTACRAGNAFGARWVDLNLAERIWVIPAPKMKAGREHRVPLSTRAMDILESLPRDGAHVFPGCFGDRPMAESALRKAMARAGAEGVTVHGFRSTFRDWCGHETSFPREIAEQGLAHRIGDASELAYRRGDYLERRRELMELFACYCEPTTITNVVRFSICALHGG